MHPGTEMCAGCATAAQAAKLTALTPAVWPPLAPSPRECCMPGCADLLPAATWVDGPPLGPAHRRGRWISALGVECDRHTAIRKGQERERQVLRDLDATGLPKRLQGYRFSKHRQLKRGGRVVLPAQRDTVTAGEFREFQAALPPGLLGLTPWNRRLAQDLRDLCRPGVPLRTTLLVGPVGTGKSTLIAAAVAGLVEAGHKVLYTSEAEMLEYIRSEARSKSKGAEVSMVSMMSEIPVLVLDDLGIVEAPRDWHLDAIETIISYRYDNDLPMLITTNAGLQTIADIYGERVASRLVEMTGRVQRSLTGPDWRTGALRADDDENTGAADCTRCRRDPCRCGYTDC